jgi:methyl-accepting chemotaxis protein
MRLTISRTVAAFGLVIVIGFLATVITQYVASSQLKVGGPVYQRIVLGKDLVADILPPPEYIIESYLEATLALNNPGELPAHSARLQQLRKDYDDRHAYWLAQDFDPAIKQMLTAESDAPVARFWAALDQQFLPALQKGDTAAAKAAYEALSKAYGEHRAVIDRIVADTNAMNGRIEADAHATETRFLWIVWSVVFVVLALVVAGILGLLVAVVKPLVRMTDAMRAIAGGDFAVTVPSKGRGDEIGSMAAALDVFRESGEEAARLRAAQEAERLAAEAEKSRALQSMAETVERETRQAVDAISALTGEMAANAGAMADSAGAVRNNSQSVAAAATQALSNVQTVASAAEELSSSIAEISVQINNARGATEGAVGAAASAEAAIAELQGAVSRISDVTKLINEIAGQTNLLALNATIEAARAGDAGRGFAVVANEVKSLATQTANATGEITQQIDAVQGATQRAVEVVRGIGVSIRGVEAMSTAIASAIEEQTATTAEIARNVTETSAAAHEVAERISGVSSEAEASGSRAAAVRGLSAKVASGIDELREILVRVVRTSTKEVDRRRAPRYHVALPGKLLVGGRGVAVTVENCSSGGAMLTLAGDAPAVSGNVVLEIERLGSVPARILSAREGRMHLKFIDGGERTRFAEAFARSVQHLQPMREAA